MFISLYTTRLLLNSLGTTDFGIFNVVGGSIAMLGFLNAAMASATQRFMSYAEGEGNKAKQKSIFNISFVLHIAIALVVGLLLVAVGFLFFNGILNIAPERAFAAKVVYGSLILSTLFTVMTVPYDAVLTAHENMLYYAIVGVIEALLKLSVAFVVVYSVYDKLIVYGVLMACIPLITMTIMRVYCHKKYEECEIAPKRYWDKSLAKEMRIFAGWSLMGTLSGVSSQYGLSIVLNNYFGVLLNAAQGIANQLSGQLMAFSNSMLKAVSPVIAKSEGNGDRGKMIQSSLLGTKFAFFLLAFFAVPFLVEMPTILGLWLDNVPAWAVLFARLQIIRSLVELLTIGLGSAIAAQGDIKRYTLWRSFLSFAPIVFSLVLFAYGFPPYSLYIVWIVSGGVLGGFLSLLYAKRKCGLAYAQYLRVVLLPCLGSLAPVLFICIAIAYVASSSLYRTTGVFALSAVLYLISFWYIFLAAGERKVLLGVVAHWWGAQSKRNGVV